MILLSTDIKTKYSLIYFKLIELKGLLKQKLDDCNIDWDACIADVNNDITQANWEANKLSFTQLIKCLVHINYYGEHLDVTDYDGYQIHNSNLSNTIHEKDYLMLDKIYYYMSFLRWFLQEMNVSQYKINQATTLKALILLLDEVTLYEDVNVIFKTDEDNKIIMYTDKKNILDYSIIGAKNKQELDIPLNQLECTCENNNVNIQIIDAQKMNWNVNDQSYQIQDGQEYWIYDFYLEADHPISDEQFYNIQCSASFLTVNFVRDATDHKKIHIYSTPYSYPRLNQNDLFIVQLPKKIVQGKTYDAVRVTYQWGEYTLTYPNGESDTGIFITPQITTQLPQEVTCTFTFNGYEQYKPLTTNFTITVSENPFVMTSDIINNTSTSIYYQSENEGYSSDEWIINAHLENYKAQPIIGTSVYLQVENDESFLEQPLVTDMNGDVQYVGTIPYFNSDFIDYNEYNMPDAIQFFIYDGVIDFSQSLKLYYQYHEDVIEDNEIITPAYTIVVTERLMQNEIEERTENVGVDDNNDPITKLFYYYVFDANHKYKINFDTLQTLVLGEEYTIEYPNQKEELELTIYTTNDPAHDTKNIKGINLYHKPIIINIQPTPIYVGDTITVIVTFCDILTGQPLDNDIYNGEFVKMTIGEEDEWSSVQNSFVSTTFTIDNINQNQVTIVIHQGQDNEETFTKEFEVKIRKEVTLDGTFISYLSN